MTPRERFLRVLNFQRPDRLPMIEWAPWWDKTVDRWRADGLPESLGGTEEIAGYFGLEHMEMISASGLSGAPKAVRHGAPIVTDEAAYRALRPRILGDGAISAAVEHARSVQRRHERGEIVVRLWLDGYFWFPRALLGIEGHLYAFYDQPELILRMNADLAAFNRRAVEAVCSVLKPDMIGFAEDMSYNKGPMLSEKAFLVFLLPFYREILPAVKELGIKALVDSDGDVAAMIPWLEKAGIEGVYPLERQAGVDLARIRKDYPRFLLMGGYDKMVMPLGEAAMRAEFERLLPVMRSGGFLPSVDHQTPPGVSLENYKIYVRLFREFCQKGAENPA